MKAEETRWNGKLFQYLATLAGSFAAISYGINTGWSSPYLPYLTSNTSYIKTTSEEGAWCAVAPLGGCAIGPFLAAGIADRIGRKYSLLLLAPVVSLCYIAIGYVRHIWYLSALRFVIGFTDGILFTVLPMYVGEISDPDIRGFLSSSIALAFILGTLVINIAGSFFSIFTTSVMAALITATHFLVFMLMPESPYYYVKKNKYEAAEKSLRVFKGRSNVSRDIEVLQESVTREEKMTEKPKYTDIITVPSNRKAFIIFLIIIVTNKMGGKMPVMFYTATIFQESGSNIDPTMSTILYYAVELVVATVTTFFIIDRFGKRYVIIISAAGSGITVFLLALYFYLKDLHIGIEQTLNWLPITSLITYNIVFSIGLTFAPMLYLSELFPMNVKANALCVAQILTVIFSMASSLIFQAMIDSLGTMSWPFLFFSIWSFLGTIFLIKYLPETKGKTLEEIQEFLLNKTENKQMKS